MSDELADDIVALLDRLTQQGCGHINISANDSAEDISVSNGCADCGNTKTPCMAPTLHKGFDE